jgi:hypothetical protein
MTGSNCYEELIDGLDYEMTLERRKLDNNDQAKHHKIKCAITSNHDTLTNFLSDL